MKTDSRVDLVTSYLCNNNCIFCIHIDKKHKYQSFKEYETLLKTISDTAKKGRNYITLNGGEPTIHPQIVKLVELAKSSGFKNIQLTTNGRMLAYKEFAKKLMDAGVNTFFFSLHGEKNKTHDNLTRTPYSFEQALQGIDNVHMLRQGRKDVKLWSNTTILEENYTVLPLIINLLKRKCVDMTQLTYFDATPFSDNNFIKSMLPRVSDAEPYIKKALSEGGNNSTIEGLPYCVLSGYENFIAEAQMPENWEIRTSESHDSMDKYAKFRARKKQLKYKSKKCESCRFDSICEGMMSKYVEVYGFEEFNPVK